MPQRVFNFQHQFSCVLAHCILSLNFETISTSPIQPTITNANTKPQLNLSLSHVSCSKFHAHHCFIWFVLFYASKLNVIIYLRSYKVQKMIRCKFCVKRSLKHENVIWLELFSGNVKWCIYRQGKLVKIIEMKWGRGYTPLETQKQALVKVRGCARCVLGIPSTLSDCSLPLSNALGIQICKKIAKWMCVWGATPKPFI